MFPTACAHPDLLPAFVQLHWDDADALDRFADKCEEIARSRRLREEARALRGESQQARSKWNEVHVEARKVVRMLDRPRLDYPEAA